MTEPAAVEPQTRVPESRLVADDGTVLILREARLRCAAGAGLARNVLWQRFTNPSDVPLELTYQLPLPADGAVSGFAFGIGERRVVGEIDRREAAKERFEEALIEGRTAALVEQDRDDLFQQRIGNVPPNGEVIAEITVDQLLAWCDGGEWEWRFPTVVAPRYVGGPGQTPDADRVVVDVVEGEPPPRLQLELRIDDDLASVAGPSSPSHEIDVAMRDEGAVVSFAGGSPARLDRDVVVRWGGAGADFGTRLAVACPEGDLSRHAFGVLSVAPPEDARGPAKLARDVVVLLDTSGSMHGDPIVQAKRIVAELVRSLGEGDTLEMIAFASRPARWRPAPERMSERSRRAALRWLDDLEAGGGTDMESAIVEALRPLGADSLRQVVLVTDGEIGFERIVIGEVLRSLPPSSRLHTVGVGSCPNRSLTRWAARAGRGTETLTGLGEDSAIVARRLLAATAAPRLVDLEIGGSALVEAAPARPGDVLAGAPASLALKLSPDGGSLWVAGRTSAGAWRRELHVAGLEPGNGRMEIVSRFARERVADLETRIVAGEAENAEPEIEALGLAFGIATRLTSWVAIASEPGVDATEPMRRVRIPQELPSGVSVARLGLRPSIQFFATFGTDAMLDEMAFGRSPTRTRGLEALSVDAARAPRPTKWRSWGVPPSTDVRRRGGRSRPQRARLVRRHGRSLCVELMLDGTRWQLPSTVELIGPDRRRFPVRVDTARTTRTGLVPADAVVRLWLEAPARSEDAEFTGIEIDGVELAFDTD